MLPDTLSPTSQRLAVLRRRLAAEGLDAYLVPSTDEHLNEYLPEAKRRREWLSGFTGSVGDLLVGSEACWLFVDSRYHQQAALEVDPGAVRLGRLGREGEPTLLAVLRQLATERGGLRLGYDPSVLSLETWRNLQRGLERQQVRWVAVSENLIDWLRIVLDQQTPHPPAAPIYPLDTAITGEEVTGKLARLREVLRDAGATILPLTRLDQVAWLFNLRGSDIPYNPVFTAFGIVTLERDFLCVDGTRLPPGTLTTAGVAVLPYEAFLPTLAALVESQPAAAVLIDPQSTTAATWACLQGACLQGACLQGRRLVEAPNPIEALKGIKNSVECAQIARANLQASRAKVRLLAWLDRCIAEGSLPSEAVVAEKIASFYAAEPGFRGLSFHPIAALGEHTSIVHYGRPDPGRRGRPSDLLLVDSGAQYLGGTTDDTRTVSLGEPTPLQIVRYTEVLKAHINCAMQRFPRGTLGCQLDGITRASLWLAGLHYGHGTGHGVGAFLNVHEGPHGLNGRTLVALEPGMVTSIEPGYYEPDWGGIRIENLYLVHTLEPTRADLPWYAFEPLSWIPFDRRLIDPTRLDERHRTWLTHYYAGIVERLAPTLDAEEAQWLHRACLIPGG
jgi:Xaa-Pro aminopeptidase